MKGVTGIIENIGGMIGTANTVRTQAKTIRPERNVKALETNAPEASEMNSADSNTVQAVQSDDSRKYDRPELSSEYLSGKAEKSPDSSKPQAAPKKGMSAMQPEKASAADVSEDGLSADISSEEVNSNELYKYTDSQLKDLLPDGSISQSEYNSEIAKRES